MSIIKNGSFQIASATGKLDWSTTILNKPSFVSEGVEEVLGGSNTNVANPSTVTVNVTKNGNSWTVTPSFANCNCNCVCDTLCNCNCECAKGP